MPSLIDKLQHFDRRWIFMAMALAIVLPVILPLNLPTETSPPVKSLFYTVDGLRDGSTVVVSVDFDPASQPELEPFFHAVVAHLKKKNAKIVFVSLWYSAPPLVERWFREDLENEKPGFEGDRTYERNKDYVWMGFKEGKEATIQKLGQDMWDLFGNREADGTPLEKIPMMRELHRLENFDLFISISAGNPGAKEYVQVVQSRYKLRMVVACTAVSMTDLAPYYASGQLLGLAGGMAATAEYEREVRKLLNLPISKGKGAIGLDVLNIGVLVVIAAIIFGNVIYFVGRRQRG